MNDILPMAHRQRDGLSDEDEAHDLRDDFEEEGSDKDKIDEGVLQDVIDDDNQEDGLHM